MVEDPVEFEVTNTTQHLPESSGLVELIAEEPGPQDKTLVETRALEVLEGRWGSGEAAIRRRMSARHIDPDPILAEVARLK